MIASDIQYIWNAAQSLEIINHPEFGWISPFWDRAYNKNKACPYCDKNMVHGQELYSTSSKQEAIERSYQYEYFCKHEQKIKKRIKTYK